MNHKSPNDWKNKVQSFFTVCQDEITKTTEIGKKMFTASKTSGRLRDCYEEIGRIASRELRANRLQWDHPRVRELNEKIRQYQEELELMESDVQNIKK